jgi:methylated-DNA-[protein]-cysteine S-methyltransferase
MMTATRTKRALNRSVDDVSHAERLTVEAFETSLGWMAVAFRTDALCGVVFGHTTRRNAELALARSLHVSGPHDRLTTRSQSQDLPHWTKELIDDLRRYADGEAVHFDDVPLALDHLTTFGSRVVAACRSIRWGQTRSYGELASECEAPAKNRYPLVVPCHRVLAAGGALGGYSAPDGLRMKRRLLAMEHATD